MTIRRRIAGFAVAAVALAAPAAASAATWTEIPSGTPADITAIEYQGADRFWIATGSGQILRRVGGAFQVEQTDPATVFRDIEFQSDGNVGFAVGTNGAVWRSADGGDTWAKVTGIVGGRATEERCDLADQPIGDVDAVRFSAANRAWLIAGGSQIYRTVGAATATDVGASAAGWEYINDNGASCKIPNDVDDAFFVPGSQAGYFTGKSFGFMFFTADALTNAAVEKAARAGNGFEQTRRLAGDPANPNRQWAVMPGGEGASYVQRTTDGWNSAEYWTIANADTRTQSRTYDVDIAGGSVLAAGEAGMILHSIDGQSFYFDDADGALATQDWLSVGVASAQDGAVGGRNGKLAVTSDLATLPDIVKPEGTVSGPASVVAGQAATYTASVADNPGGSGIDPGGFSWTATGLPGATGTSATFTFPQPGVATVQVTFRDNAGNTNTASLVVNVTAPGGSQPQPQPFDLDGPGNKAPVVGGAARRKGGKYVIRVRGRFGLPPGTTAASACRGDVFIRVLKAKRLLVFRKTRVTSTCRYRKLVRVPRAKVGKAKRLKLRITFAGNQALAGTTKTYRIKVRRR